VYLETMREHKKPPKQAFTEWLQEESGKLEERALESRFIFEVLSICVDCGRQTDK